MLWFGERRIRQWCEGFLIWRLPPGRGRSDRGGILACIAEPIAPDIGTRRPQRADSLVCTFFVYLPSRRGDTAR